jgi:hypothetical protein
MRLLRLFNKYHIIEETEKKANSLCHKELENGLEIMGD